MRLTFASEAPGCGSRCLGALEASPRRREEKYGSPPDQAVRGTWEQAAQDQPHPPAAEKVPAAGKHRETPSPYR